jgi:hypothetical protein
LSFADRIRCRKGILKALFKLPLLFVGLHGLLWIVCVFVVRRRVEFLGHNALLFTYTQINRVPAFARQPPKPAFVADLGTEPDWGS